MKDNYYLRWSSTCTARLRQILLIFACNRNVFFIIHALFMLAVLRIPPQRIILSLITVTHKCTAEPILYLYNHRWYLQE